MLTTESRLVDTVADYLVCGACTQNFPLENFTGFVQHKKFDCNDESQYTTAAGSVLLCQSCPSQFVTPWSLLQHAQRVHALRIYLDSVNGQYEAPPSLLVASHVAAVEATDGDMAEGVDRDGSTHRGLGRQADGMATNGSAEKRVEQPVEGDVSDESAQRRSNSQAVGMVKVRSKRLQGQLESEADKKNSDGDVSHAEPIMDVAAIDISKVIDNAEATQDSIAGGYAENGEEKRLVEDMLCCDDQDCGVTVVPLTHESPRKCCNAVLPKKRKRHMETKHLGASAAHLVAKARREKFIRRPANIYIDLVPNIEDVMKQPKSSFLIEKASINERSVIIQPGRTFSIPVRCTTTAPSVSTAKQGADTSSADEVTTASTSASCRTSSVALDESDITASIAETFGGQGRKRRYPTSRPFKCDQCSDAFNQRIHLKKHLSKHTGVKPFKCGQCSYSTVERSHLKVHIRVHTGEKPFRCTFCEYATAQNSTLKIHLKRHHAATVGTTAVMADAATTAAYDCKLCGGHFTEADLLQGHLRQEHASIPQQQTAATSEDLVGENVKHNVN